MFNQILSTWNNKQLYQFYVEKIICLQCICIAKISQYIFKLWKWLQTLIKRRITGKSSNITVYSIDVKITESVGRPLPRGGALRYLERRTYQRRPGYLGPHHPARTREDQNHGEGRSDLCRADIKQRTLRPTTHVPHWSNGNRDWWEGLNVVKDWSIN